MSNLIYSNPSGRHNRPSQPSLQRPKKPSLKLVACLLVALLAVGGFLKLNDHVKAVDHAQTVASRAHQEQLQGAFGSSVNQLIAANPAISFSVSTIDLSGGVSQHFGVSDPMEAASVGKLLTAAVFLEEVEKGHASLSAELGGETSQAQLRQLIQQSDDNAWELFNDALGHDTLLAYAQNHHLDSYNVSDNTIGTDDVARLLRDLYQGQLLNAAHTKLLLSYMQNTNYEDFITPAVPSYDKIYHKVGLVDDNVNDAAIITSHDQAFVLVIFTDGHGTQDWDSRAALIQKITTQALKTYFN